MHEAMRGVPGLRDVFGRNQLRHHDTMPPNHRPVGLGSCSQLKPAIAANSGPRGKPVIDRGELDEPAENGLTILKPDNSRRGNDGRPGSSTAKHS